MIPLNVAMPSWYDYRLVALSVIIAIFASFAAIDVASRVVGTRTWIRWWWWAGGTTAMAVGVWTMHYTAILALRLPVPILLDWPTVAWSFLSALFGSAVAFYLVLLHKMGRGRTLSSGIFLGLGISSLHYVSMAAMRVPAVHRYNALLMIVSVLVSILASFVGLRLAFQFRSDATGAVGRRLASALVVGGGAISGMHYTAMLAVRFLRSPAAPNLSHAVSISFVGTTAIGVVALLLQGLAMLTSFVDRRLGAQHELTARILQSQDEERRRIARQLHETVAQSLAALKMSLSRISRSAVANDPAVSTALSESIAVADESAKEVRTLSYLLHPPLLEEVGLFSALRWYVSGYEERSGTAVTLKVLPEVERFPKEIETAVFRIVQESLTNIHRHSGSPSAEVRLRKEGDRLMILEVEDAGRGIPPGALKYGRQGAVAIGVGIAGMQERVKQLGGKMRIHSSGRGTRIVVTLPIKREDSWQKSAS